MNTRGPGLDHDRRRQDILDAVFAIVDTDGVDYVSIRNVADRAGVSAGRVQHYFPSKDDLLSAAFVAINDRGTAQVRDELAGSESPAEVLAVLLKVLIPPAPDDVRLFRIGQAFEAYALTRPALQAQVTRGYGELAALFGQLLPGGRGEEMLALVLGLAALVVAGSLRPKRAHQVATARLREILAG